MSLIIWTDRPAMYSQRNLNPDLTGTCIISAPTKERREKRSYRHRSFQIKEPKRRNSRMD
jgi:hypothetical protein